ncbi:hypothetical protein EON82_17535 [bacterium]|nr:MAG: hypothetical protein EON82_17535 [bacterium]
MVGETPPKGKRSIAEIQYAMLVEQPYRFTQDDVLFESSSPRRAGEEGDREAFFSRPQACLRCSPLVKRWGWGIHFDSEGKAAAFAKGSEEYRRFLEDPELAQTRGMRSKRG